MREHTAQSESLALLWREGWQACRDNKGAHQCPYCRDGKHAWLSGWRACFLQAMAA